MVLGVVDALAGARAAAAAERVDGVGEAVEAVRPVRLDEPCVGEGRRTAPAAAQQAFGVGQARYLGRRGEEALRSFAPAESTVKAS